MNLTQDLMSVVYQSQKYMQTTRAKVVDLGRHFVALGRYMHHLKHTVKEHGTRINELEMRVEMDRAIADAERVYDTYEQQVTHFHA